MGTLVVEWQHVRVSLGICRKMETSCAYRMCIELVHDWIGNGWHLLLRARCT